MKKTIFVILVLLNTLCFAQDIILGQIFDSENKQSIPAASVVVNNTQFSIANNKGEFSLKVSGQKSVSFLISSVGYSSKKVTLQPPFKDFYTFFLHHSASDLSEIVLTDDSEKKTEISVIRLKPIEGTTINAGKKNEVILTRNSSYNTATNSSRQIFSQVPGLNIWESDQTGLQLEIGARGLSPQRTSNFNTRQNGYDIAADALGYPESYYTPPTQAVEKIQLIRGAASLQYGPQFGGMLNFHLKRGNPNEKAELTVQQSVGSNQLYSTFASVGGQVGKTNYYTFGQYKNSKGWRPNSSLSSINFHASIEQEITQNFKLKVDYSKLYYTAQQPGGLTDAQFEDDPYQSNRTGNWFQVDWNVFALRLEHKINAQTEWSSQFFGLYAKRNALGYLKDISWDESKFTQPRDLILSTFRNFGNETKLIHRYDINNQTSALLLGLRYYQGNTKKEQGFGPKGKNADFYIDDRSKQAGSFYTFPSNNISFFAENIFPISTRWSLTPGIRWEKINTRAQGYNQVLDPNNGKVIIDSNQKDVKRSILLFGLGSSYQITEDIELYANFSRNYRAINFNDLYENNYNIVIDPNLKDESGYNTDLGFRGLLLDNKLNFDASLFYLKYADRIGFLNKYYTKDEPNPFTSYRLKTNISDSRTWGIESFVSYTLKPKSWKNLKFRIFNNFTYQYGTYINSDDVAVDGKEVELIPNITWKAGIITHYKRWQAHLMFSYVGEQFSDAENSLVSSQKAITGLIPSYEIMDFSIKYNTKNKWQFSGGVNNIFNKLYFTRRATGYPGPGIIPSPNRNYFLSIQKTI
jgi:Fe(3+) dicitrate transport protein